MILGSGRPADEGNSDSTGICACISVPWNLDLYRCLDIKVALPVAARSWCIIVKRIRSWRRITCWHTNRICNSIVLRACVPHACWYCRDGRDVRSHGGQGMAPRREQSRSDCHMPLATYSIIECKRQCVTYCLILTIQRRDNCRNRGNTYIVARITCCVGSRSTQ